MRASLMFAALLAGQPAFAECLSFDEEAVASAGVDAVIEDDYGTARLAVEGALATLECLDHVVGSRSLAMLWQLRAAMAHFDGESDTVAMDLRQAAAVNHEFFEDRLGGDLRAMWEQEVAREGGEAKVRIQVAHRGQVLWVDGVVRSGAVVELRPGTHLAQVVEGERLEWTRLLDVRDGETASFDLGEKRRFDPNPVLLGLGAGAAAGAALTGATAVVWDRKSYQVTSVEEHEELWLSARQARAVSVGLASTAVLSWGVRRLRSQR